MKASILTVPVIAKEITDARIGPTHGVHKSPKDNPTTSPDPKPDFKLAFGANLVSLEKSCSMSSWNWGIRREIPKRAIVITERSLNVSAGIPLSRTRLDRKRVKKVKLKTKPMTTPKGLPFPRLVPPRVEDKIIGRSGNIHGESTVTTPAKNANMVSKIIGYLMLTNNSSICPPFHFVTSFPCASIWTNVCW